MSTTSPIPAPCRSLSFTMFGGDGGRLCVMGGGCSDAAELGRGRRSCFYSCLGCFQLEIGNRKQQGQLERTTFRGVRANSPAHRRNAERKRGVSVLVCGLNINHGQSRTVLANARLKFGRSCFCSCSSCQFEIRSAA